MANQTANKVTVCNNDHWFQNTWKPAMAWAYLVICVFDFIIAPVFFALLSAKTGMPHEPWVSLTLGQGGMFHIAMGAVIGVTAWGKSKERLSEIQKAMTGDN